VALDSWDERYLAIAMQVSQWSKDPRSKMGAVITDVRGRVVALGYNGFPENVHDCPTRLNDPSIKYDMVVHAEANAVIIAGSAAEGGTVYVYGPRSICGPCAGILIQAGIRRAVAIPPSDETQVNSLDDCTQADWSKKGRIAIEMFKDAGVEFERVNNKTAVGEMFTGLINWAKRNKGAAEISYKLHDIHELVTASSSFDMPP
jgi:dCMP deaminase